MNKPILIGLTGGIGSGKTLVSELFALLGAPIYNADTRAKALMNSILVNVISNEFGKDSYKDGVLNRAHIAKIVFGNSSKLEKLNSLVHPAVATDFDLWTSQHHTAAYLLKEAALLVENNSYKLLDKLIVVTSPIQLRVSRIKNRDSFRSNEEIEKIIASQTSDNAKIELADFVINNDESNLLIPQVLDIDKKIRGL